ncbi:hypothetical protein [Streptomyces sp. NPDC052302]
MSDLDVAARRALPVVSVGLPHHIAARRIESAAAAMGANEVSRPPEART